jgi:hypothetical protein
VSKFNRESAPGEIWVCQACGRAREGKLLDLGDTSCVMWAELCHKDSLVYGPNGLVTAASAVKGWDNDEY